MKTSATIVLAEILKHLPGKHNQQLHAGDLSGENAAKKQKMISSIRDMTQARRMAKPVHEIPDATYERQAADREKFPDAIDLIELQLRRMPYLENRSIRYIGRGRFEAVVDEQAILQNPNPTLDDESKLTRDEVIANLKEDFEKNITGSADVAKLVRSRFLNSGLGIRQAGTDGLSRDEVTVTNEREISPEQFEQWGTSGIGATGRPYVTVYFPAALIKRLQSDLNDSSKVAAIRDSTFAPELDSVTYSDRVATDRRLAEESAARGSGTKKDIESAKNRVWTEAERIRFGK